MRAHPRRALMQSPSSTQKTSTGVARCAPIWVRAGPDAMLVLLLENCRTLALVLLLEKMTTELRVLQL